MAKKGQIFNSYTEEFKMQIIKDRQNGASANYIAKKYKISRNSVWSIIRKYERTGTVNSENNKKVKRIMNKYYIKSEYIRMIRPNSTYKRI
jgi:transposase-like protein